VLCISSAPDKPGKPRKIREEHDVVLGVDLAKAATKIKSSPQLLNQLPYTSGVIKEVLRLFPPVGTVRQSNSNLFLTQPETGICYPTDGFMIFGCSTAGQRNGAFWERPDDFVPERWLAREGDPLHVRKNAYRPFELGPRNCIGQELAQQELRAILALTVREFDVKSALPEDGKRVLGELAYQVMRPGDLTSHPVDGMPVRIEIRS
jgi:cytochrome P450